MSRKLSPSEVKLYRRVDEVLHYKWDPIGVSGMPEARDEYHGYLPQVFGMLNESKGELEIAAYLVQVESDRMGLDPKPEAAREIARLLIESAAHIKCAIS